MSVVASTVSSVWVVLFDDPQDLDSLSVKQRFEELIRTTLAPKDLITALYITNSTAHTIIPGAPASIFFSDWNRLSPEQLATPERMYDGSHPAAPECQAIWYAVAQNRLLLGDDSDDIPVTILSLCHKTHPQADTAINAIPGPIKQLTDTTTSAPTTDDSSAQQFAYTAYSVQPSQPTAPPSSRPDSDAAKAKAQAEALQTSMNQLQELLGMSRDDAAQVLGVTPKVPSANAARRSTTSPSAAASASSTIRRPHVSPIKPAASRKQSTAVAKQPPSNTVAALLAIFSLLALTAALGVQHLTELGISSWPGFLNPLMGAVSGEPFPAILTAAFLNLMLLVITGLPRHTWSRVTTVLAADALYLVAGNIRELTAMNHTIDIQILVGPALLVFLTLGILLRPWFGRQATPYRISATSLRRKRIRMGLTGAISWAVICMAGLPPVILTRSMLMWSTAADNTAQYGLMELYGHLIFTREWWVGVLLLLIVAILYVLVALAVSGLTYRGNDLAHVILGGIAVFGIAIGLPILAQILMR